MCGRLSLYAGVDVLVEVLLVQPPAWRPRWNIAPTQPHLVLWVEDGRRLEPMRWGLVPPWAEDPEAGPPRFNIRSETVSSTRVSAAAFQRRRCLVPATGFYEWQRVGRQRVPHHFTLPDQPLMLLAGLWKRWRGPEGDELRSFTLLTTAASPVMAPIHDRMPVILAPEAWERWLDPRTDAESLRPLLRPWERLARARVSDRVNDWRNDDPGCVAPPAQGSLFA